MHLLCRFSGCGSTTTTAIEVDAERHVCAQGRILPPLLQTCHRTLSRSTLQGQAFRIDPLRDLIQKTLAVHGRRHCKRKTESGDWKGPTYVNNSPRRRKRGNRKGKYSNTPLTRPRRTDKSRWILGISSDSDGGHLKVESASRVDGVALWLILHMSSSFCCHPSYFRRSAPYRPISVIRTLEQPAWLLAGTRPI